MRGQLFGLGNADDVVGSFQKLRFRIVDKARFFDKIIDGKRREETRRAAGGPVSYTHLDVYKRQEYAQLQLRDTTIQDPALVAPFLSAMIDTADDSASMIDELIVMLQKKREKLAAKKQT